MVGQTSAEWAERQVSGLMNRQPRRQAREDLKEKRRRSDMGRFRRRFRQGRTITQMGGPESTGGLWDIDFDDEMRSVNLTVHPAPGEEATTISLPPELALNLAEALEARARFLMN
jgi:hypothetical protein